VDALKTIQEYIQRVPGPWYVTFGAAQIGKSLSEPNYGCIQFLVSEIEPMEEGNAISFVNFNGTSRMNVVTEALYEPRYLNEETISFLYANAVVLLSDQDMDNWPVWLLCIEKFDPLADLIRRRKISSPQRD
jgi:hypothetical protein